MATTPATPFIPDGHHYGPGLTPAEPDPTSGKPSLPPLIGGTFDVADAAISEAAASDGG